MSRCLSSSGEIYEGDVVQSQVEITRQSLWYLLLRHLLPRVDVGILRLLKGPLEDLELLGREGGARAPLLPLERDPWLALRVALVGASASCGREETRQSCGLRRQSACAFVYTEQTVLCNSLLVCEVNHYATPLLWCFSFGNSDTNNILVLFLVLDILFSFS